MKNTLIELTRKWALLLCVLLATTTAHFCFGEEPGITQILPTISQLGEGWSSNRVVLLVDPLSSPSEVADNRDLRDPEASLRERREMLARNDLVGHGFIRYYHGNEQCGVFVTRFKSRAAIEEAWKRTVREEKLVVGVPSGIGENLCAYKEHDMHNDVSFRRGSYLITVESGIDRNVENLIHLAKVLDARLSNALDAAGVSRIGTNQLPYILKTSGGIVTITNEPNSNPVHVSFKAFELRPEGEVAIFSVTNTGSHRILPWNIRVQVRTVDSSTNGLGPVILPDTYAKHNPSVPAAVHSGWKTVQDDFPPSGRESRSVRWELDEVWVHRPDRTPWRVCIVYSTDWTDSGNTASGNYEVISQEMTE